MKQTAVEWLVEQLQAPCRGIPSHILEEAKQMEKEQLDKAYYKGQESKYIGGPSYCEQYYNETYKGGEQ